jgi:hypothetical protein
MLEEGDDAQQVAVPFQDGTLMETSWSEAIALNDRLG